MKDRIKLKVCGMRDVKNITEVNALLPDYMGFIFYQKSPRFVGDDFQIPANFPTNIIRVGVFVDETTDVMLQKIQEHKLQFLQLHGAESVKQCAELKHHNVKIIKALSVDDETNFTSTKDYSAAIDFWLFDTKGKYHGGNSKTFNWKVLHRYDQSIPFFLSGGLSPDNVLETRSLLDMNLHAIDINSGVELQPGLKDINKIKTIKNILNSNTYAIQG
jgi:phosphoribosylanthranilate isomerase